MPESTTAAAARPARPRPPHRASRSPSEFAARHAAAEADEDAVDFDVADASRPRSTTAARPRRAPRRGTQLRGRGVGPTGGPRRATDGAHDGPGHRLPDLSALPPLLAATGTFAALRERLGRAGEDRPGGSAATPGSSPSRTGRSPTSPRPWPGGDRASALVWIARDAEIGDRVAEELGAWLGDPDRGRRRSSRGRRSPTSGASSSPTRRPPGSPRSPPGAAAEPGSSSPASRRSSSTPSRPDDLPADAARAAVRRPAPPGRAAARPVRPRLRAGDARSPGAASSRGAAASSTSSRRRSRCRSGSSSSATRSTRCGRSTRPTSGPIGKVERGRAPAGVGVPAPGRRRRPRSASAWARAAARLPERLAADLARFEGAADDPLRRATSAAGGGHAGAWSSATPPRSGPPSSPRRPASTTSTRARCSSSTSPGDIAEAAAFLWRQADERRAELIEAGELPKDWPSTYLAAARLEAPARRVADARADLGVGAAERTRDGRAAPLSSATSSAGASRSLPLGRAGRLVGRGRRLAGRRRPDRPRLRPGAAARRDPRRGRPSGRPSSTGWPRRRRPARSRSSGGASTAASPAARTAWSSSPTASCSGRSASAGPRRCDGSCRATCSSG